MYRASSILKNARLDKELTHQEIAKKIKIAARYLEALEDEDRKNFPQEPYCSMIVKDYADFLGLNGSEILRFFHRDFDPKRVAHSPKHSRFGFTPQFTFTLAAIAMVILFSGYLLTEYIKFNRPPHLKVNWPQTVVADGFVEINGLTDPESTVRVNDDLVIVDSEGSFQKRVKLGSSGSKIVVESKSPNGKTTTEEKTYPSN